jgi:hypothetical protein
MIFKSLKEKYNFYRNLTDYRLLPNGYIMVMLDGRSFSKKIKNNFKRPFDKTFINLMNETAKYVCEKVSGCKLAYVQSDEINLVLYDNFEKDPFFGNRLCKLQSIIASIATSKFNQLAIIEALKDNNCPKDDVINMIANSSLYEFDCKVWNVPNVNDAFAGILYRQNDCIRNSKEAVAQNYFSHKTLQGKKTEEQIELVKEFFGVNWYNYFTRGEQYGRLIIRRKIKYLPLGENLSTYERDEWNILEALPFNVEKNRVEIVKYLSNDENNLFKILVRNDECITQID